MSGTRMTSFNVFGFGWDENGWSVALGVVGADDDNDNFPRALFGIAIDKEAGFCLDILWIQVL